jgi:general stress protein YciG
MWEGGWIKGKKEGEKKGEKEKGDKKEGEKEGEKKGERNRHNLPIMCRSRVIWLVEKDMGAVVVEKGVDDLFTSGSTSALCPRVRPHTPHSRSTLAESRQPCAECRGGGKERREIQEIQDCGRRGGKERPSWAPFRFGCACGDW